MKSEKEINEIVDKIVDLECALNYSFSPILLNQIEDLVKDLSIEDLLKLDIKISNLMTKRLDKDD